VSEIPKRSLADMPASLGAEATKPAGPGRPTLYTDALADELLSRLSAGESLRQICRDPHMPDERRVREWAIDNREGFSPRYAHARQIGWESIAEETLEIADDGSNDWYERELKSGRKVKKFDYDHVERSKLRVDTRKWLLAKMLPALFGDKLPPAPSARPPELEPAPEPDEAVPARPIY